MFKGFLGLAFGIIAMGVGCPGGYSFPEDSKLKVEEIVSGISSPSEQTLQAFQKECHEKIEKAENLWSFFDAEGDFLLSDQISYGIDVLSSVLKIVRKILECEKIDLDAYKSALNDVVEIIKGGFFSGMEIYSQDLNDDMRTKILDLRDSFWLLLLQAREIISISIVRLSLLSSDFEKVVVLQALETLYPYLDEEKRRLVRELFIDLGRKDKAANLAESTGDICENNELY